MSTEGSGTSTRFWRSQLPVDYLDDSLTINTWETVSANLSGGAPARLWYILVEQTNDGAANENIELEITINGTAYTFQRANAVSGTQYSGAVSYELTAGDFAVSLVDGGGTRGVRGANNNEDTPFIARSIGLIRVRQTTDVDGVSAQIEVNIVWDKLVGL